MLRQEPPRTTRRPQSPSQQSAVHSHTFPTMSDSPAPFSAVRADWARTPTARLRAASRLRSSRGPAPFLLGREPVRRTRRPAQPRHVLLRVVPAHARHRMTIRPAENQDHLRDRRGHDPVPQCGPLGFVGRTVPVPRRECGRFLRHQERTLPAGTAGVRTGNGSRAATDRSRGGLQQRPPARPRRLRLRSLRGRAERRGRQPSATLSEPRPAAVSICGSGECRPARASEELRPRILLRPRRSPSQGGGRGRHRQRRGRGPVGAEHRRAQRLDPCHGEQWRRDVHGRHGARVWASAPQPTT